MVVAFLPSVFICFLKFFSSSKAGFCLEGFQSAFSSCVTQTDPFIYPIHWPPDLWSWISWKKVHLGGSTLSPVYLAPQAAGRLAHPTGILSHPACECHTPEKLRVGLITHLPRQPPPKPTGPLST